MTTSNNIEVVPIKNPLHYKLLSIDIDTSKVYELNRVDLVGCDSETLFGRGNHLVNCVCDGTGVIGDLDNHTTQGEEALHFSGGNLRECHVCRGSGYLVSIDYHSGLHRRIYVVDRESTEERIKREKI